MKRIITMNYDENTCQRLYEINIEILEKLYIDKRLSDKKIIDLYSTFKVIKKNLDPEPLKIIISNLDRNLEIALFQEKYLMVFNIHRFLKKWNNDKNEF